MNIYIMTKGRVGRQETLKWIPAAWREKVFLVCPPNEVPGHDKDFPWVNVIHEPYPMNYSQKFQFLLNHIRWTGKKGVIVDDDLWFDRRISQESGLSKIQDVDELNLMWDLMNLWLDKVPLVGVHPRMMGHQAPWPYKDVGKIITVQGVNLRLFPGEREPKVDYDPILADVHLNCHLLSRGYPNRLITRFVVNWQASQAPGGCDYRTLEMQQTACERVADMYGPYAKVVWKKAKSENWLGPEGRPDLRVQWKKLYEERPNA